MEQPVKETKTGDEVQSDAQTADNSEKQIGDVVESESDSSVAQAIKDAAKELPELESVGKGESYDTAYWALFNSIFSRPASLEKRMKDNPKRTLQHFLYSKLLEDRVASLEEKVRKLEGKPPINDDDDLDKHGDADIEIKVTHSSLDEFSSRRRDIEKLRIETNDHQPQRRPPQCLLEIIWATVDSARGSKPSERDHIPQIPSSTGGGNTAVSTKEHHSIELPLRVTIGGRVLRNVLAKITNQSLLGDKPTVTFVKPFKLFAAFETQIRDHTKNLAKKLQEAGNDKLPEVQGAKSRSESEAEQLESQLCLDHLQALLGLFDNELQPALRLHHDARAGKLQDIAFDELWYLFRSGDEVLDRNTPGQAFRVVRTDGGQKYLSTKDEVTWITFEDEKNMAPKARHWSVFRLHCFYYNTDGTQVAPMEKIIAINPYDGRKPIKSLPCYPLRYEPQALREHLIERGRSFISMANPPGWVHKHYHGLTLDEVPEEIDSEVVVDPNMALLKNEKWKLDFGIVTNLSGDIREVLDITSKCTTQGCCGNPFIHADGEVEEQRRTALFENKELFRETIDDFQVLGPNDYLICSRVVLGFVLRSRKWANLDVDIIRNPYVQEAAFDFLVLEEGHKETLLSLVQMHSKGKGDRATLPKEHPTDHQVDVVRGKGKGLIILLHGEPGVGKTSTAESIAQYTRRPLQQLTCGDIGQTAEKVERNLENNFQLAHKWGCVLLLDEADVFLAARDKRDLERNAIVSVFLRVLEYYSGILFLTTNRIGTFDPAFRSRIHMSLYYPKLGESATIKIWERNINRLKEMWGEKLRVKDEDVKKIMTFAKEHFNKSADSHTTWNGRQIRNAFQTAVALAEYDAHKVQIMHDLEQLPTPRLLKEHFEKVAEASQQFDSYIIKTRGNPDDIAAENRERLDNFGDEADRGSRSSKKFHYGSSTKNSSFGSRNRPNEDTI